MNQFPWLIRTSTVGGEARFALGDPLVDSCPGRPLRVSRHGPELRRNLIRLRAIQQDAFTITTPFGTLTQPERANHDGGVLRFGPDGKLYVLFGDVGRRGQTQNLPDGPFGPGVPDDQFGGPEPDDASASIFVPSMATVPTRTIPAATHNSNTSAGKHITQLLAEPGNRGVIRRLVGAITRNATSARQRRSISQLERTPTQ